MDGVKRTHLGRCESASGQEDSVVHSCQVDPTQHLLGSRTASAPMGSIALRTSVRLTALETIGRRRLKYLRSAVDSCSATASLTIADESR